MRIKFGKWNDESTGYYSSIIEENTHLTPGRGRNRRLHRMQQLTDRLVMARV